MKPAYEEEKEHNPMRTIRRVSFALAAVAAAALTACTAVAAEHGGHDTEASAQEHDHSDDATAAPGAAEVAVTAGAMAFAPGRLEIAAGEPVNIALTSSDGLHDLTVDEIGFHVAAEQGATTSGALLFEAAGEYDAYCSLPGHRAAGMVLKITVT